MILQINFLYNIYYIKIENIIISLLIYINRSIWMKNTC